MAIHKPTELVTPDDIDPAKVTIIEFGNHSSVVRDNKTRVWKFYTLMGENKFKAMSNSKRFKRKQNG